MRPMHTLGAVLLYGENKIAVVFIIIVWRVICTFDTLHWVGIVASLTLESTHSTLVPKHNSASSLEVLFGPI